MVNTSFLDQEIFGASGESSNRSFNSRGQDVSSSESASHSSGSTGQLNQDSEYAGIDYRIKQLSYSSSVLLHKCPRKYQLYKRNSIKEDDDITEKTTFSFGHAVGSGIQWLFEGFSLDEVIWKMFLSWKGDILFRDEKRNKSLAEAIHAIEQFEFILSTGAFEDYELVYVDGKPATELSFCINLPDNFRYRGFVDIVLRHKSTGKVVVVEVKTTGFTNISPALYKNSAQALGYSVVLDVLFPELNSYEVIYLVYKTKEREFTMLPFPKTYLQRAKWIQDVLIDIEFIKAFEELGDYPMRGESCFDFGKECKYFGMCGLKTGNLVRPFNPETDIDVFPYQITLGLTDLISTQEKKNLSTLESIDME